MNAPYQIISPDRADPRYRFECRVCGHVERAGALQVMKVARAHMESHGPEYAWGKG